ncbi:MAG TPA: ATP-binding protein [Actinomycetota bacterium]|nr:ATP-binding protein [Actinomycetota bacterium]
MPDRAGAASSVLLEIPPQSAYVAIVRLAFTSLGRAAGLDEEKLEDLKIAISESCANAVLSTQEAGVDAPVTISFTADDDCLEVVVADSGAVHAPGSAETADSQGFSTRHIMSMELLRSLVDEFEFSPRAGGGMQTRLMLRR